ncbi:GldG family protein [Myxococcota bacterium]
MATVERKRNVAAQTGVYILVLGAIVVIINLLSASTFGRLDMTLTERFTLSKGSARLVQNLKEPIQVDAYVIRGMAHIDAFVVELVDLLREYERNSNHKFQFTVVEANTDDLRKQAKEAGLQEMRLGAGSAQDSSVTLTEGYMGLVFKYGSERAVIPQLSPNYDFGLEFWITNKIREIRDKEDEIKHRIGVITGKDELKLSDNNLLPRTGRGGSHSLKSILQQVFPFYSIEDVDLKNGDNEIDKELVGLVITQPAKDYSEKELRRIDQFLMLGSKALAVFAGAATLKAQDASMDATLSLHGLDKLLPGYGLDVKKNVVFDQGASFVLGLRTLGGMAEIRHPGVLILADDPRMEDDQKLLDTGFAGFFRMQQLAFPFPSSIELLRDRQPADVTLKPVAQTSEAAAVQEGDSVSLKLKRNWAPKPPFEQRIIAAVAEGKLKSAFAGKPDKDIKVPERAPQPSRVLVLGSGQFLTNPFAYAGNGPEMQGQFQMFGAVGGDRELQMIAEPYAGQFLTTTILSLKNTLDWMSNDADLIAASAKILAAPALQFSTLEKPKIEAGDNEEAIRKKDEEYRQARTRVQNQVQWSLTLGVPLLFAGLGVGRWQLRQSKRNKKKT